ncbi:MULTISPECIES: YciI family protein [Actinomadura]|uniref:YCII-related domain-containing protein n=1 Tax=Actinomadura litoris TaxID=2678616 RepID=A0A7K1LCH0_9ACTN|nr:MULTISPECIES: YciI family protein [Actinomadura]MBT2208278.1 hypothetical protein [Actinomadura sp. NEAU-AAG7]MUN42117.1 hypothetical protein [Actinomadura litoris]
MKLYALNMFQPEGEPPPPEFLVGVMAELAEIRRELEAAEAWVFGAGLYPPEASTVVRAEAEQVIASDGPYVVAPEYLGGITVIRVEDLDAALWWAARYAQATRLPIEVRPFRAEV